jgi:glycosyltransferase involved in cell wall biosynthesis
MNTNMATKPIRFMLVSTHSEQTTGYSKVSYNLLRQLSTLHPIVKVFQFGFQRAVNVAGGMRKLENVIQYDAAANEDPKQQGFGFNKLAEYIETVSPDIIMIYNDPIVINQFLDSIKDVPKTFKIWIYLDLVYEHPDQGLIRNIEQKADRIFCFTEKWKQHLLTKIPTTTKPINVMEHGVDTMLFKRNSDSERIAIRKQLNIPADATVFLNINRNSERKRLDLAIMGFARLLKKFPDNAYYMVFVTGMNPQNGAFYNPIQIFVTELQTLGIDVLKYGNRIVCVDTNRQLFDDGSVNAIYNACNYGINTSNGEGFGLCQLEHLATGAPQLVVDIGDYHSFMDESVAVFVKPTSYAYLSMGAGIGSFARNGSAEDIAEGMEKILQNTNIAECIKIAEKRPWSRICDGFLEIVATHSSENV